MTVNDDVDSIHNSTPWKCTNDGMKHLLCGFWFTILQCMKLHEHNYASDTEDLFSSTDGNRVLLEWFIGGALAKEMILLGLRTESREIEKKRSVWKFMVNQYVFLYLFILQRKVDSNGIVDDDGRILAKLIWNQILFCFSSWLSEIAIV